MSQCVVAHVEYCISFSIIRLFVSLQVRLTSVLHRVLACSDEYYIHQG